MSWLIMTRQDLFTAKTKRFVSLQSRRWFLEFIRRTKHLDIQGKVR